MEVLDRAPGRTPNPTGAEEASGRAEGVGRLRALAEALAVVSAAVLAGGGVGMLGGIWLGAINPYALGLMGAAAGAAATVLTKVAVGGRGVVQRPRWRRWLGG